MGAGSVTYFHIKAVFIIKVSRCSSSNVGGGLFAAFDCRKSISLFVTGQQIREIIQGAEKMLNLIKKGTTLRHRILNIC